MVDGATGAPAHRGATLVSFVSVSGEVHRMLDRGGAPVDGKSMRRADEEIVYWFRVTSTPVGGAPLAVRAQWVGVLLPVRRARPVEGPEPHLGLDVVDRRPRPIADGVAVARDDVVAALVHFERPEAAAWWAEFLHRNPRTSHLVFRRAEGDLLPPRLAAMLHPEVEDYGT